MTDALLIIFVKNKKLGHAKTRLAKTIGDHAAFYVYEQLLEVTEKATTNLNVDVCVYFSEHLDDSIWKTSEKAVQHGSDLGERMLNAFKDGFNKGHKRVALIGSDLPDLNQTIIKKGFEALTTNDVVLGPAEDGGYYFLGMKQFHRFIFENKPWSQSHLFKETTNQLKAKNLNFATLVTLNDIDTFEDLVASNFYKTNLNLQEKIKKHD